MISNNNIYKLVSLLALVVVSYSCTEKFELEFENQEPLLVVDGKITNQAGPYYVRLSESVNKTVRPDFSGGQSAVSTPIENAIVSLSDNAGNTETLKYIGAIEDINPEEKGWYIAESIEGVVGRTYTLQIDWNNQTFIAIDKMEAVPEIEKITIKTKHLESKNEDVSIPLIFFNEPQGIENYYLIYYSVNGFIGSNRNWAFSIISDRYLTPYVNGLEIDDGQSPSGRDFYSNIGEGSSVEVYLESLTEGSYHFYEDIISQFGSDGGAFTSSPSSPRTNVSGRAQGLFRASAVSTKSMIL